MADEIDFDLKQHDFLRAEIQASEGEARLNERYCIVALAALWAWAAKEVPSAGPVIGVISAAIGVLGGLRMWALWVHMKTKADYVAQIEAMNAHSALGGWEHYFRDVSGRKNTIPSRRIQPDPARRWYNRPGLIGYTSAAFWLIIALLSFPVGLFLEKAGLGSDSKPEPVAVRVQCVSSTESPGGGAQ